MYNPEIKYCDEKQHLLLPGVALNKLELFLQKRKIPYSITSPGKEDYDDDWESDDYIDESVNVDWNAENWREQLENDMIVKLHKYAAMKGYSFNKAN